MTVAEEWRQEGIQEGEQKGEARVLLDQSEAKFGAISEGDRQRVETADAATLRRWSVRILTATAPEEVFAEE